MRTKDLSKTILSIQPRSPEAAECLQLSLNDPYITRDNPEKKRSEEPHGRGCTPQLTPSRIEITLETDMPPRDKTRGWIFGSDPARCDRLLDQNNQRGVSGVHFEINFNWTTKVAIIINRSSHQLKMKFGSIEDLIDQGKLRALCETDCFIQIETGLLIYTIEIPDRGEFQSEYESNLETYSGEVQKAVPTLSSLGMRKFVKSTPGAKRNLLKIDSQVPRYYVICPIGHAGSSGRVYKGVDRYTAGYVAMKFFHDDITAAKISSEIQILKKTLHVNIVRYLDYTEAPDKVLIMELVEGQSLADIDTVSRSEILLVAQHSTRALSYLHDQEITHRDIKPANLLVSRTPNFTCKIADFGESHEGGNLKTFSGTSLYQAPEIYDTGRYSNAVDIWALGIVIWQYWYDCLPDFVCESRIDELLPDTHRAAGPGAKTFQREAINRLQLTESVRKELCSYIWRKLESERIGNCLMSKLLLGMLQLLPTLRKSASYCREYLDGMLIVKDKLTQRRLTRLHNRKRVLSADLDFQVSHVPENSQLNLVRSSHRSEEQLQFDAVDDDQTKLSAVFIGPQVPKHPVPYEPPLNREHTRGDDGKDKQGLVPRQKSNSTSSRSTLSYAANHHKIVNKTKVKSEPNVHRPEDDARDAEDPGAKAKGSTKYKNTGSELGGNCSAKHKYTNHNFDHRILAKNYTRNKPAVDENTKACADYKDDEYTNWLWASPWSSQIIR